MALRRWAAPWQPTVFARGLSVVCFPFGVAVHVFRRRGVQYMFCVALRTAAPTPPVITPV